MNRQSENNDLNKKFENYTYPVDDSNWEAISAGIPAGSGDGFLAGTFATYAYQPSSQVWNKVDVFLRPSSGRRVVAWWWYAAAASLLLFSVFTYVKYNTPQDQPSLAEQKVKTENKSEINDPSETTKLNSNSFSADTINATSNTSFAKANTKTKSETVTKTEDKNESIGSELKPDENENNSQNTNAIAELRKGLEDGAPEEVNFKTNTQAPINQLINKETETYFIQNIQPELQTQLAQAALIDQLRDIEIEESESIKKKVKSSPFYDGTERSKTKEFSVLAGSQLAFAGNKDNSIQNYSNEYSIATGSPSLNETSLAPGSVNYSTPIYYGVNGEIEFVKRLSVGTGLGYLRMDKTSDFYSPIQDISVETENRYLSIPVYLKFDFIQKPKFSAYTSIGNAYDIQIWQKTTSETYTNGELTNTDTNNENQKGNQANVYAGLGITFNFTKHFGLYTEGSIMRYYYTSNNNFYSQKKFWPGLRFGAVVSF